MSRWHGVTRTRAGAAAAPAPRTAPAVAYDSARAELVMFGGTASPGVALDETRRFDGVCAAVESCRVCPAACAVGVACPIICADFYCDGGETISTCPGDCTP